MRTTCSGARQDDDPGPAGRRPRPPSPAHSHNGPVTVKGTLLIYVSGPASLRDPLVEALRQEGVVAHPTTPQAGGDAEAQLGWVETQFHEGTDAPPTIEFQGVCRAKVDEVAEPFGYQFRALAAVMAGAADMRLLVHKETGQIISRGNIPEHAVPQLAAELGLNADDLELREPPGLWDIPG